MLINEKRNIILEGYNKEFVELLGDWIFRCSDTYGIPKEIGLDWVGKNYDLLVKAFVRTKCTVRRDV